MKGIAIAVLTDDESYGRALARGIAEESERVKVRALCTRNMPDDEFLSQAKELADGGYVLVTDRIIEQPKPDDVLPDGTAALGSSFSLPEHMLILSEERTCCHLSCMPKLSPVREIFSRIKEIFLNVTGTEFFRAEAEEEKVIGFFAETGGCGVTAAAVVLSRWLALSSDKPVLYVNAGPKDDYAYYLRPTTGSVDQYRPKKELLFHIIEKLPWNLEKYCFKDSFAVHCLKPEPEGNCLSAREYLEKFLAAVTEKKYFQYIVTDGMRSGAENLCDMRIGVCSSPDKRSVFYEGDEDFATIYNFAAEEISDEPLRIYIPPDEESFQPSEKGIDISMEGIFAARLRDMCRKILAETDGLADTLADTLSDELSVFVEKKQLQ